MIESDDRDVPTADRSAFGSITRYDLVLAIVPGSFLLSLVAGRVLSLPPHLAFAMGAVLAAAAIGDGLFRNPPGTGPAAP